MMASQGAKHAQHVRSKAALTTKFDQTLPSPSMASVSLLPAICSNMPAELEAEVFEQATVFA